MKKLLGCFAGLGLLLGVSSCETDFSLNGEYEITPVVIGLLDHADSVHLIKITKAFLGDGDNLLYAQTPDSSYFNSVDAWVTELDESGEETGRKWNLLDTLIENKSEDGVFYAPEQRAYYFEANDLNPEYNYKLEADLNEGEHSISAETELLDGFSTPSFLNIPTYRITFAKNSANPDDAFTPWLFECQEALNAAKYVYGYTFHWTEYYADGTSASFSALKEEDFKDQDDPGNPLSFSARFEGQSFYEWVQDIIPEDPNVVRRTSDGLDLFFAMSHFNLNQFMEVSEPVTGIAQIQPVFTNINGGYGLFSSRHIHVIENKELNAASVKQLATGQYTFGLRFCSPFPEHNFEDFYCD